MTERYILVSDEEYCYTLDTEAEDYKTLEDFEKIEFENAKKDNVDIGEYEDAILQLASDNYWDWVYNNHLEADTVNDIMNVLYEENQRLKNRLMVAEDKLGGLMEDYNAPSCRYCIEYSSDHVGDYCMSENGLLDGAWDMFPCGWDYSNAKECNEYHDAR